MPDTGTKLVASNRKARRDFTILETFEAGLVLRGAEVKSLRTNQVQMADAYARFGRHDAWLEGVHIAPYSFATGTDQPDPDRPRKLLLHSAEIEKIGARVAQERLADSLRNGGLRLARDLAGDHCCSRGKDIPYCQETPFQRQACMKFHSGWVSLPVGMC
jgi:hypothetical protein